MTIATATRCDASERTARPAGLWVDAKIAAHDDDWAHIDARPAIDEPLTNEPESVGRGCPSAVCKAGGAILPVLYVHGVATRRGPAKDRADAQRTALTRQFLGPVLAGAPDALSTQEGFWGEEAASFAWRHASLPGTDVEELGTAASPTAALVQDVMRQMQCEPRNVVASLAHLSPAEAFDLLWLAAAQQAQPTDMDELAELAAKGAPHLRDDDPPAWLTETMDDRDFVSRLAADLDMVSPDDEEHFGGEQRMLWLREGLSRITHAAGRASGSAFASVARSSLHRKTSMFIGDILVYLHQRGSDAAAGAIGATVLNGLRTAADARTDADPHLVVMAHSMGGNIVYDLLSRRLTDVHCDVLVTVGSQVGVFAELGLFDAVKPPDDPSRDRVPALTNVSRWVNVFDPNDMLSFSVERIFHGGEDFEYSTGRGLMHSHSSYFVRPSFYDRLARRLPTARLSDVL